MKAFSKIAIVTAAAFALLLPVSTVFAATPGFGNLYYNGKIVRTVVPPAALPQEGRDNFYKVPGQLGIAAVAPGSANYHGGDWRVFTVSFNGATPVLLTSEQAVLKAQSAGMVTVTRNAAADFRCPIQP